MKNKKKKNNYYFVVTKERLIVIFGILLFIFFTFQFKKIGNNFFAIKKAPKVSTQKIKNDISADKKIKGVQRSFGDGFSSFGYINKEETSLVLNNNATAFSFEPDYVLDQDPKINKKDIKVAATKTKRIFCLNSGNKLQCLKIKGKNIYLNNKLIVWPEDLQKEKIANINISILSNQKESRWLLGIVTGEKEDKQVFVYIFDGHNFHPLITNDSRIKIRMKYKHKGGRVYFGGNLNDFLILYNGYEGRAVYYHQGELQDISEFFSLRIIDGGFPAQIIRAVNTNGSVFYVCSQGGKTNKLIKVWSNGVGELTGSIDFSPFLPKLDDIKTEGCSFSKTDAKNFSNQYIANKYQKIRIFINFKKDSDNNSWLFIDRGFNNNHDYQVVSKDLGRERKNNILAARINNLILYPLRSGQLFLANEKDKWFKVKINEWHKFKKVTDSLYWKAVFKAKPEDKDYSPCFYAFNDLNYITEH